MNPLSTSGIVFACTFGGAMASTVFRGVIPPDHLSADSKEIVKLGMGLVATMSALVLGLLVSSAKSSYDTQSAELTATSAQVVLLDRVLAHYGPEAKETRELLRGAVVDTLDRLWPQERGTTSQVAVSTTGAEDILVKIEALSPGDDTQRSLKAQAFNMVIGLGQTRWLVYEQGTNSVSKPMLVILVFWLTAIFMSFGLFAPRNLTVVAALLVSGLSVSGAIFLILELYMPFRGLIEISSAPMRFALAQLGK
jgi:hypothetical protein